MEKSRTERLQALKDRWFTEPLSVHFPSLGIEMPVPTTCAEYVGSERIIVAEEDANLRHFGVVDPKAVLAGLSAQFEFAPTGQVDPKALKDAATVLDVFKADSDRLAAHFAADTAHRDDTLHASYAADAKAAAQCQAIVSALASELGISLTTRGTGQSR